MQDRRKTPRFELAEPVILVSARGDFVGEVRDLSARGMFVALDRAAEDVGAHVVVRVVPSLDLAAVVRWRDARGLGLELDPSADDVAQIERLVLSSRQ